MEVKLIKLVQENKCLYDRRDSNYRNKENKEKIWKEISDQLNTPVDRVKTRWSSLRDRYHRENKKSNVESGNSSPKYWKYYQHMNFMKEIPKKKLSSNFFNKEIAESPAAESELDEDFLKIFKEENNKTNNNNNTLTEQKLAFVEEFVNCFGDTDGEEIYLEDIDFIDETETSEPKDDIKTKDTIKSKNNNSKEEDVDELFCRMLSASLKSLSRMNNIKAKTEIFQVLEKYVEKEENNR